MCAVVVLVAGCDIGLDTRGGKVSNGTRQDLVVEVVGASEPSSGQLPAGQGGGWSAPDGECLGTGVAVYTPDGELLATLDERICDGQKLRIEDEDLPATDR